MRVSGWRVAADGRNRGAPTRPPSLPQALRSGAALSANADRLQATVAALVAEREAAAAAAAAATEAARGALAERDALADRLAAAEAALREAGAENSPPVGGRGGALSRKRRV